MAAFAGLKIGNMETVGRAIVAAVGQPKFQPGDLVVLKSGSPRFVAGKTENGSVYLAHWSGGTLQEITAREFELRPFRWWDALFG